MGPWKPAWARLGTYGGPAAAVSQAAGRWIATSTFQARRLKIYIYIYIYIIRVPIRPRRAWSEILRHDNRCPVGPGAADPFGCIRLVLDSYTSKPRPFPPPGSGIGWQIEIEITRINNSLPGLICPPLADPHQANIKIVRCFALPRPPPPHPPSTEQREVENPR